MRGRKTIVVAGALSLLIGVAGFAWGSDPPGNNGTVKVADFDSADPQGNEPHVGCLVNINFFGFDEGPLLEGSATFELIAPTALQGTLAEDSTLIGGDPAGGANDLDGTINKDIGVPIALSGVAPTAQGWHVKLTTHADGSIGADVKHKTFWVNPGCGGGEGGGGEG